MKHATQPTECAGRNLAVHIRWQIRRDMEKVLAIEDAVNPKPWTEDDFLRELRKRNVIAMVAEYDEKIAGFMVYELHRDKIEVLNFAVHPTWQRYGIGSQMVKKLVDKLSPTRRNRLHFAVCETNLDAQLFLRSQGFKAIRVEQEYFDSGESAYLFEWRKI